MALADLIALADVEDAERWVRLTLGYTDPIGAPWLRAAAASVRPNTRLIAISFPNNPTG